jgi:predicted RNase H-like nuclease (RuvC/YqgF family)
MLKIVFKTYSLKNAFNKVITKRLCSNWTQSFDLEKYLVKLKSDERIDNNGNILKEIHRINSLFDERMALKKHVDELQIELDKTKKETDNEFHELMADEKTELSDKINSLSEKILDSIYYYELQKSSSQLPNDINCLFEITAVRYFNQ